MIRLRRCCADQISGSGRGFSESASRKEKSSNSAQSPLIWFCRCTPMPTQAASGGARPPCCNLTQSGQKPSGKRAAMDFPRCRPCASIASLRPPASIRSVTHTHRLPVILRPQLQNERRRLLDPLFRLRTTRRAVRPTRAQHRGIDHPGIQRHRRHPLR